MLISASRSDGVSLSSSLRPDRIRRSSRTWDGRNFLAIAADGYPLIQPAREWVDHGPEMGLLPGHSLISSEPRRPDRTTDKVLVPALNGLLPCSP